LPAIWSGAAATHGYDGERAVDQALEPRRLAGGFRSAARGSMSRRFVRVSIEFDGNARNTSPTGFRSVSDSLPRRCCGDGAISGRSRSGPASSAGTVEIPVTI
jgi:hypothetical protein